VSAKPYSDVEIAERAANPLCVYVLGQEPYLEPREQRWLATVDAIKARLAAADAAAATAKVAADLLRHRAERAEARNERMRQALEDAKMAMMDVLEEGHSGDYGATPEDMRPVVRRIEALLKEVPHGQG
jgi:hypothetical protein